MLTGENVFLRAMEPEDIEPLFAWENNTENWLNSNTHKPFSRYAIENHVLNARDVYTDQQLRLMIALNGDLRTVGAVDLFDCDFVNERAGVGILIEHPNDRGKGYGQEALQLLQEYCRDVLMLHQLHAEILAENKGSIRLFERVGFSQVGVRKEWVKRPEGFLDLVLLQHIF